MQNAKQTHRNGKNNNYIIWRVCVAVCSSFTASLMATRCSYAYTHESNNSDCDGNGHTHIHTTHANEHSTFLFISFSHRHSLLVHLEVLSESAASSYRYSKRFSEVSRLKTLKCSYSLCRCFQATMYSIFGSCYTFQRIYLQEFISVNELL